MEAIKNITVTDNIKGITYNLTSYNVETIDINDIEQTYIGKSGCACGCNGDYTKAEDNMSLTQRRLNKILTNIDDSNAVEMFNSGAEWHNEDESRVTRIYFNDGVTYEKERWSRFFVKTIRTDIDNA